MTPTFEGILWMAGILFIVSVCIWLSFLPSGPKDGEK